MVMERTLGRFPNEEDLSVYFRPGVRFYFRYDELIKHPNAVCSLKSKIMYVENDCMDIWDWSEKVYRIIESVKENKNGIIF